MCLISVLQVPYMPSESYFYMIPHSYDNKANKKTNDAWLAQIEELARRGECVAILAGLDLSRLQGEDV